MNHENRVFGYFPLKACFLMPLLTSLVMHPTNSPEVVVINPKLHVERSGKLQTGTLKFRDGKGLAPLLTMILRGAGAT